jgi:uncharacterized protein (DUF305 family)
MMRSGQYARNFRGMTASRTSSIAALLLATVGLTACGGSRTEREQTAPEPAQQDHSGGRGRYTEADVRFMSDMIGHHAQALVMAGWAPTHGASSSIRNLAERIVNGQQDEIATMRRWLTDRGHPAPEPGAPGSMPHDHHHPSPSSGQAPADSGRMPGMLTEDQMKELDHARGSDFDRLFLQYMIQHHQGAVTMVNRLFNTPGAARDQSVFKLASDVSADQSSEIARMERMLAETRPPEGS